MSSIDEAIDFLTDPKRRGILYDNAARFLKLDPATVAAHHGN